MGSERRRLRAGQYALVPAGIVHTFATVDDEGAQILVVMTPEVDDLVTALHSGSIVEPADLWAVHRSAVV